MNEDFSGSPVVKTPSSSATGSATPIPGQKAKILHALRPKEKKNVK